MILATEEYHGVAGGSFSITLAKPTLSFAMDLLTEMCSGMLFHALPCLSLFLSVVTNQVQETWGL